jgi:HAD superfamily hydrolase (TIGR01509 family)
MPKALLFDLDGTIALTDPLHHRAFQALFQDSGIALSAEDYRRNILGRPNSEIMARYYPGRSAAEHARLAEDKETAYRAMLPGSGLAPMAGLTDLLGWLPRRAFKAAVVTNAPRVCAEAVLNQLGLATVFDGLVIGDECRAPKPDPAPYLAAMAALGVAPADCIAFEDASGGLVAARRSGALTIGLTSSLDEGALRDAGARHVIHDFTDPFLWTLLDQFAKEPAE